jgi:hypothetical protein
LTGAWVDPMASFHVLETINMPSHRRESNLYSSVIRAVA